ncbi:hypothetical protein Ahy_A04g020677 [Arachis hypogaea]|uniref:Uncharacterized protein n=1 Tax=Arachis hypogaea TaxID=3818 RepID=A0A445DI97_ARAHY|nr:hypothetical protein Ahy_A04g020677 [Arachis hypogaea]
MKEAMKPANSRKIVHRFNKRLQPIGNEVGIRSDVLGLLGSNYTKFPICEKDWRKEMFYFEEDSGGIIKRTVLKMLGRAWNKTRNRPPTENYCESEMLYTHTSGSKSLARLGEEEPERQGNPVGRRELFVLTHKRLNGSYLHDAAKVIGERIAEIEQHDESSRLLSQNDSLAQALGEEHPGRVHGMGIGLTFSQVFGTNSHQLSNETQREETQSVLFELQAELAAERTKR